MDLKSFRVLKVTLTNIEFFIFLVELILSISTNQYWVESYSSILKMMD